jgi:glucosylceramidase
MKIVSAWVFGLGLIVVSLACSSPASNGNPGSAGTTGAGGTGGSVSCPPGQMASGTTCIDTTSDSNNCGGVGIPCLGGHTCQGGVCRCPSGLLECNGSCVASDASHCGSCTMMCTGSEVCSGGTCTATCAGTVCGTACCGASQICMNNACVDMGGPGTGGMSGTGGAGGYAGTGGSAGTGGRGGSTAGTTGTAGSAGGTGGSVAAMPKVITSAMNAYWNTSGTITTSTSTSATVTVNDGSPMQTWEGFGGAFNEMGWANIQKLSAADQTKAMQLLFGADGAHFVIGRIPIGASDYAMIRYTAADTANDTNLTSFSISRDMMYLIPYVKAAQAVNGSIRFWASPWTPPAWMKTRTGSAAGTQTSCGNPTWESMTDSNAFDGGCMQETHLNTLANYFVKWIQAYKGMGITIDTLAPQNEPNYAQGYPSAIWAPSVYVKFLPILNTALTTASLSTKIMLGTMSNGDNGASSKDLQMVQAVMQDATAKGLVKMIGLQWGMLDLWEGNQANGMSAPRSAFMNSSNLPVWATEHRCGNYPWNKSTYKEPAPNDHPYGIESWGFIKDAITKGGVTSYNAWNMVLDASGKGNDLIRQWSQDSLLVVNSSNQLVQTPAFHVFRHASQYAAVGAKVLPATGGDAFAFKNPDGSQVAVMFNSGNANPSYTVKLKGTVYQFSMPASGWATVVVP